MDTIDTIIKQLPSEYVNEMGREALEEIYNFNRYEVGMDEITTEDMLGWRKYYSVKECCEKLGLTGCDTWDDVTEYYPVYNMLSDGAILVAVG
jgi:hypothetical protein